MPIRDWIRSLVGMPTAAEVAAELSRNPLTIWQMAESLRVHVTARALAAVEERIPTKADVIDAARQMALSTPEWQIQLAESMRRLLPPYVSVEQVKGIVEGMSADLVATRNDALTEIAGEIVRKEITEMFSGGNHAIKVFAERVYEIMPPLQNGFLSPAVEDELVEKCTSRMLGMLRERAAAANGPNVINIFEGL